MKNIKKLSLILFTLILSIMCLTFFAGAEDATSGIIEGTKDNISYKIYQDVNLMIISGEGKIPAHMFGSSSWCTICHPETEDDAGPFDDGPEDIITDLDVALAKVKTLIIEEGITEIGHEAFLFKSYPKALQTVVLPEGLRKIDVRAFYGLRNLNNINFPSSLVEIENSAFESTGLKNVTVPETVEKLGKNVFKDCNSLKSIVFTNAVCDINDCDSLEKITYPLDYDEVPVISGCDSLKRVITPVTDKANRINITSKQNDKSFVTFVKCPSLELVTLSDEAFAKFKLLNINYMNVSKKLPTKLNKVTNLRCTDKGNFTVSWTKVENAGYYQLYWYNKGYDKWVKLYEGGNTSFTQAFLNPQYGEIKFMVRACAFDGKDYIKGAFTSVKTYRVGKAEFANEIVGKNKVTLTLKMESVSKCDITAYQVFYRVQGDSSFKKYGNVSGTKCMINNLTSGKTYQFIVRAYYKLDGKIYYGAYGPMVSLKIK